MIPSFISESSDGFKLLITGLMYSATILYLTSQYTRQDEDGHVLGSCLEFSRGCLKVRVRNATMLPSVFRLCFDWFKF